MKSKSIIRPWHPDLRNLDTLPDTKVVRTDFLINTVALFCLLLSGFLVSQSYFSSASVQESIERVEGDISALRSKNNKVVAQDKVYREQSKVLQEFNTLNQSDFNFSMVLYELSQLMPDQAVLDSFVFEDVLLTPPKGKAKQKLAEKATFRLSATGYIEGNSMEAYAILNQLKKMIGEFPLWKDAVAELDLKSMGYSRVREQLPFSLTLSTQ